MGPHGTFASGAAISAARRILLWHVHRSWTTAFARGRHDYLSPLLTDGGGRPGQDWPAGARERPVADLRDLDVDLVVLQRIEEPRFTVGAPLDVFGIGGAGAAQRLGLSGELLRAVGDLAGERLYDELAQRRFHLHPVRWRSLRLSLIEAMLVGMPVVGSAATEAATAVPKEAGVLSTDVAEMTSATRRLVNEPDLATAIGEHAGEAALARHGLARFLATWDRLVERVARRPVTGDRR